MRYGNTWAGLRCWSHLEPLSLEVWNSCFVAKIVNNRERFSGVYMKKPGYVLAALLSCSLTSPFSAPANTPVISGQITHANIQKLNTLSWYKSMGQAQSEAMRTGKMIFWLNILGEIDGAT